VERKFFIEPAVEKNPYAEKKNAWATAPMLFRYSWWAGTARKTVKSELGTFRSHRA
jgi:hypothetical protein